MEALGINLPGLLAQLVNFGLLFLVLRSVAWGPITSMLETRRSPRPPCRPDVGALALSPPSLTV